MTRDVYAEFERFRAEKEIAIRGMIVAFVKIQLEISKKICATWQTVLEKVDGKDGD